MSVKRIPLKERPKVLCVDDEIDVLEGLELALRRGADLDMTTDPWEALKKVERGSYEVIISDMRMPEMNGAVFLARCAEAKPQTVRVLLTGQSDLQEAVAAVNEGGIFRFLLKPCPPPQLVRAIHEASEQYRLQRAERDLLEQTVRGSVQVLTELLSLVNPSVFGRATRIKRHVTALAKSAGLPDRWKVEVAAMLGHLGLVTCTPDTVERIYLGKDLSTVDQSALTEADQVTHRLLREIPRLDEVAAIIESAQASGKPTSAAAQILRVASDYDKLAATGTPATVALERLRANTTSYDSELVDKFRELLERSAPLETIAELAVADLCPGMVLAEDVRTRDGALFAARGYEVTDRFVARAANFPPDFVEGPVRVVLPRPNPDNT